MNVIPDAQPLPPAEASPWLPRMAAVGGSLYFLMHSLAVILGPETRVMEWLYDDSFYYMVTAKHWSEARLSSFDGVTVTNGYHPLWMWMCSWVYGLRGQLDLTYVRLCMGLTLAITSVVLLLTLRYAWVHRRTGLLWAIALATSSYSALNNGLTPMEWPLVLLCWFALHTTLVKGAKRSSPTIYAVAFLCGFAGSFSRTDFGLIPACYLAAALLLATRHHNWTRVRQSLAATVGSALALPLIFLYNFRVTGAWLQQSAQVKHMFASLSSPFNPVPALWQFVRVLLYLPPVNLTIRTRAEVLRVGSPIVLLAALVLVRLAWKHRYRPGTATPAITVADQTHQFTHLAAILGILGYLLLDGLNSQALYGWYTASVTGFIVLLTAGRLDRVRQVTAAMIVVPVMLLNMASAQYFGGNALTQMGEVAIGKALHADHPEARSGGGDVGKPAFYNNGTMFNLDGLMNNEVVPYLANGTIHCYLLRRHIEYLSDLGSITLQLTNAVRIDRNLPPLPWQLYLTSVPLNSPTNASARSPGYVKTNFEAIEASGECDNQR